MIIYILIIIGLIVACVLLFKRLNYYRSYYKYNDLQVSKLEKKLEREKSVNQETLEQLTEIAYTNPLTKIGNMDFFLMKAPQFFELAPTAKYTLVAFGIRNIGKINQLFGPTEGDNAVYFAAHAMKELCQSKHHVYAQVYSNLFCMIMRDRSREDIETQIRTLTEELESYNENFEIESAFGIYEIDDINKPIMDMVNACLLSQKYVKDPKEKNFIYYSEELEASFKENKKMSLEMEQAMEDGKFLMYLQPILDLKKFRIIGAEALVRWDYPGKGILSPHAFIPLFESTNLAVKLDYYMWEECMKTIRRWIDNHIDPIVISMNVSSIHFENTAFIDELNRLCEHYLIDKKYLVLELPEQGIQNHTDLVVQLKQEGYTLCIDNFGSVDSPLNMLRQCPVDKIKIDRSFLYSKEEGDYENHSILRYLIAMVKELDLIAITEGVETIEQVKLLEEIGCDAAQGYFFSKPLALREFDQLGRSMVRMVYENNEYYPTFEDLEKDLDLINFLLNQSEEL